MRGNISIAVSLLTILLANSFYFFPRNFISELGLSFSPYIIFGAIVFLIINSINLVFFRKNTNKKLIFAFTILLLWITVFLYGKKIQNFYDTPESSKNWGEYKISSENKTWFTLMFSNIYYKNTNTQDILDQIQEKKPDVIAFVEFSLDHKAEIYDTLIKKYPYSNITQRSKTHAGNIVLSKYPLQDLNSQTTQGRRRYNYIAINYNTHNYYLYVVHTTAPITPNHFSNRNAQLKKFTQDILTQNKIQNKQENDNKKINTQQKKVIIVGDFNISPRSAYYQETLAQLPFKNITKQQPWLFTRKFNPFPLLKSHIDHIFLSDTIQYGDFQTFQLEWSDHKGILLADMY